MFSVGPYDVRSELGRGATGVVYLAIRADGVPAALKVLDAGLASRPGWADRFEREAGVMAALASAHCVRVYDHGRYGATAWIAMEYVQGASLRSVLRRYVTLSPAQACGVLRGCLAGLGQAHALGLVHRDFKPENVLVDREGTSKLADFGLTAWRHHLSGWDVTEGSPAYMSPEQIRGEPLGPASDLYSAGVVLCELLTGRRPFEADSPEAVMLAHVRDEVPALDAAPPALAALIRRTLAKDPSTRPASAEALAAELDEAAGRDIGPGWMALAGVSGLVAGAGVGVALLGGGVGGAGATAAGAAVSAGAEGAVSGLLGGAGAGAGAGLGFGAGGGAGLAAGAGGLAGAGAGAAGVGALGSEAAMAAGAGSGAGLAAGAGGLAAGSGAGLAAGAGGLAAGSGAGLAAGAVAAGAGPAPPSRPSSPTAGPGPGWKRPLVAGAAAATLLAAGGGIAVAVTASHSSPGSSPAAVTYTPPGRALARCLAGSWQEVPTPGVDLWQSTPVVVNSVGGAAEPEEVFSPDGTFEVVDPPGLNLSSGTLNGAVFYDEGMGAVTGRWKATGPGTVEETDLDFSHFFDILYAGYLHDTSNGVPLQTSEVSLQVACDGSTLTDTDRFRARGESFTDTDRFRRLGAGAVIARPAAVPDQAGLLGGVSLDAYCRWLNTPGAALAGPLTGPGAATANWHCLGQNPGDLDMDNACQVTWSDPSAVARAVDPDTAFSWMCYRSGAPIRASLTLSPATGPIGTSITISARCPAGTTSFEYGVEASGADSEVMGGGNRPATSGPVSAHAFIGQPGMMPVPAGRVPVYAYCVGADGPNFTFLPAYFALTG